MADPYCRPIGKVTDLDGIEIHVGVDYDSVALYVGAWLSADGIRLESGPFEEFMQLCVRAAWEAGASARRMREEAADV